MPIGKVLYTYGISILSFLASLVLWMLYGTETNLGLLIAAIITTCLFIFMVFLSYRILFPNKRYVLTANHVFYKFGSNLFLESKLIKEKKNRNRILKKYITSPTYKVYALPGTKFHFQVYELAKKSVIELIVYKEKSKLSFNHPSFFDDHRKNNQALIEALGVEDFTLDKEVIALKYSANKEYAVAITPEEDYYSVMLYRYHNDWITTDIKKIFKEQLPHWHLDKDCCGSKCRVLKDAINYMYHKIFFLDCSINTSDFLKKEEGKKRVWWKKN